MARPRTAPARKPQKAPEARAPLPDNSTLNLAVSGFGGRIVALAVYRGAGDFFDDAVRLEHTYATPGRFEVTITSADAEVLKPVYLPRLAA